jgi:flagellin-like hook-associated protein FlgL
MVVQHNMQAINSNRVLNVTTGQQAKSTEKLSSGYKINRAADDAAGLSISEKMRRQMRGLDRASTNASDGVSSVQTAEGALNEVHDMLQRMNELATQAANGTNSQTDRESIQSEIDQLTTEIDRVAETTKFNESMLLKGGTGTKQEILKAHDAGLAGSLVDNEDKTATFSAELKAGEKVTIGGKTYTLKEDDGKVATNIKDFTKDISSLYNKDKVIVKSGSSVTGYQVSNNLSSISFNTGADKFSQSNGTGNATQGSTLIGNTNESIATSGNRVAITYTDSEGIEKVYEMQYKGPVGTKAGQWEKITGYNDKTGDANLSGISLYKSSTSNDISDDELKDVMRTATKIVATQYKTGETITYGSTDVIKKAVEENTRVGSEVYMTETPGSQDSVTFGQIYGHVDQSTASDAKKFSDKATTKLGEAKFVRETSEVNVGDDNSITIHDAKKLMAQELKTANEIGVDNKDDVSATFRKSASDIAQELALNNTDQVTVKKADKDGNDQSTFYTIVNDMKEAVGTSFNNVQTALGTPGFNTNPAVSVNPVAASGAFGANSRITVRSENGDVTELKYDTTQNNWLNAADDSKLSSTDIDKLMKDAVALDYTQDASKPETSTNPTVHWRTAKGMREDISQLETGNKVKVTDYKATTGSPVDYDTGDVEVKNSTNAAQNFDMKIGTTEVARALNFNLHVGAEADLNNKIGVDIETMNSKYLGIKGLDVVGKDKDGNNIDDGGKAATYAIDAISDAIQKVNEQRSALGAVQNRLEHTINNLDNVVENTTAAESRIRDTDIAEEMVTYSKNNILAQAGQSMLAQANQSTQGALSLLG